MLTRCPQCQTAFRVTPEQLKARQGQVRCGQCQSVFNALETLVEEMPAVVPAAATPSPVEPAVDELQTESATPIATGTEPPSPPEPEPVPKPEPEPEPEPQSIAEEQPRSAPELAPAAEPLLHEAEPMQRRTWPWLLGSLVALPVLALQAAVTFRVELATIAPDLKPALVSLCEVAGCRVELPRKIELLGIETSDLHPDPTRPGYLQLEAGLRNRAPFAQTWPHLELTITDTGDKPVVRRVLAPAEYLPAETDPVAGLAANREQGIHLEIEAAGVPAAGYRLYIFYP